jgi:hypothetical protein
MPSPTRTVESATVEMDLPVDDFDETDLEVVPGLTSEFISRYGSPVEVWNVGSLLDAVSCDNQFVLIDLSLIGAWFVRTSLHNPGHVLIVQARQDQRSIRPYVGDRRILLIFPVQKFSDSTDNSLPLYRFMGTGESIGNSLTKIAMKCIRREIENLK